MKTKRLVKVDSNLTDGDGEGIPLFKLDGRGRDCHIRYREGDLFYYEKVMYGYPNHRADGSRVIPRKYGGKIISETETDIVFEPMSVRKK